MDYNVTIVSYECPNCENEVIFNKPHICSYECQSCSRSFDSALGRSRLNARWTKMSKETFLASLCSSSSCHTCIQCENCEQFFVKQCNLQKHQLKCSEKITAECPMLVSLNPCLQSRSCNEDHPVRSLNKHMTDVHGDFEQLEFKTVEEAEKFIDDYAQKSGYKLIKNRGSRTLKSLWHLPPPPA